MLTPVDATGVLVQCDPSIKAIINKIDAARNDFIVEDLDDETVLIKETKMAELKERLKEELRDTVKEAEESESD
ncbi:transcription factor TFIIH complex subunit Tfb5 [Viridothelium virens]|uniref:General transcription and DNA repair factor IIH subunit TFB5 n=1 Tax=Viridothelium virens TaxID=1048519 RepID=A0A6A6HJ34_VIRVR|nr:transcription factor TFIIH complex subunit Tfb5 [Viridothelium virens]